MPDSVSDKELDRTKVEAVFRNRMEGKAFFPYVIRGMGNQE